MEEEEDAGNSSESAGSTKRPDLADLMTSSSGSDHSLLAMFPEHSSSPWSQTNKLKAEVGLPFQAPLQGVAHAVSNAVSVM